MAEIALLPRRLAEWSGVPHVGTRSSLGGVNMMPTAELLVVETTRSAPCPKQLSTQRSRRKTINPNFKKIRSFEFGLRFNILNVIWGLFKLIL